MYVQGALHVLEYGLLMSAVVCEMHFLSVIYCMYVLNTSLCGRLFVQDTFLWG